MASKAPLRPLYSYQVVSLATAVAVVCPMAVVQGTEGQQINGYLKGHAQSTSRQRDIRWAFYLAHHDLCWRRRRHDAGGYWG